MNRELGKCQMTATVTVGISSAHTSIFLVPILLSPSLLQQNCIPSYTIGRRRKKKMKAGQTSTPQGFLKDLLLFPFASSQPAASVAMMCVGIVGGQQTLIYAPCATYSS